jgi:hypothetical protein
MVEERRTAPCSPRETGRTLSRRWAGALATEKLNKRIDAVGGGRPRKLGFCVGGDDGLPFSGRSRMENREQE